MRIIFFFSSLSFIFIRTNASPEIFIPILLVSRFCEALSFANRFILVLIYDSVQRRVFIARQTATTGMEANQSWPKIEEIYGNVDDL